MISIIFVLKIVIILSLLLRLKLNIEAVLYLALGSGIAANGLFWYVVGHPPFIGGYGSLLFFSLIIIIKACFLGIEKGKKVLLFIALLMLFVSMFMPQKFNKVEAILDSIWLVIHVPLFFLGYLSLTTAFALSFVKNVEKSEQLEMAYAQFFIFGGILTGAVWAELSWGKFWGWDSKEVWALSTWLFVASYFHFTERNERKLALYTAFISMVLTYLVISFVVPGMHSYIS